MDRNKGHRRFKDESPKRSTRARVKDPREQKTAEVKQEAGDKRKSETKFYKSSWARL